MCILINSRQSSAIFIDFEELTEIDNFASENYAEIEGEQEQNQIIARGKTKRRKFIQEDLKNYPANLVKVVKDVTGSKVNRNGRVYDVSTLPDSALLGLPEATVVTIADGYFCLKNSGSSGDKDIFRRIVAGRLHDRITIQGLMGKKLLGLTAFITKVLEIEKQGGFLTVAEIERLIKRYKEIVGID